jgi:hypothetical protein
MKVIIAGSRGIRPTGEDSDMCFGWFDDSGFDITEVVSGGARGIDTFGEIYAIKRNIQIKRFPANWGEYGRAAGPMRNEEMAQYADALLAIWDGKSRGTAHMIKAMGSLGKPVKVLEFGK